MEGKRRLVSIGGTRTARYSSGLGEGLSLFPSPGYRELNRFLSKGTISVFKASLVTVVSLLLIRARNSHPRVCFVRTKPRAIVLRVIVIISPPRRLSLLSYSRNCIYIRNRFAVPCAVRLGGPDGVGSSRLARRERSLEQDFLRAASVPRSRNVFSFGEYSRSPLSLPNDFEVPRPMDGCYVR